MQVLVISRVICIATKAQRRHYNKINVTSPVIKLPDYAQVGAVLPKLPQHVTSHQVAIAFALASDWSMTWRKYLKHIKTTRGKEKPQLIQVRLNLDSQLNTALLFFKSFGVSISK